LCSSPTASGQTPLLLQGPELVLLTASSKLTTLLVPELGIGGSTERLSTMSRKELSNALKFAIAINKYWKNYDLQQANI